MLEIQVLAWDSLKNVSGLNQLMGTQPPLPLDNGISNTDIKKNKKKTCTKRLHTASTQKDSIVHYHKNE
jgi:hypothetical protein